MSEQAMHARNATLNELETVIDRTSLSNVLDLLADICGDKGEHLRSNWQDENTAKVWEHAGKHIARLAASLDI